MPLYGYTDTQPFLHTYIVSFDFYYFLFVFSVLLLFPVSVTFFVCFLHCLVFFIQLFFILFVSCLFSPFFLRSIYNYISFIFFIYLFYCSVVLVSNYCKFIVLVLVIMSVYNNSFS